MRGKKKQLPIFLVIFLKGESKRFHVFLWVTLQEVVGGAVLRPRAFSVQFEKLRIKVANAAVTGQKAVKQQLPLLWHCKWSYRSPR